MEETGIELDCEEVSLVETDDGPRFELICDIKQLTAVESRLEAQGFAVESAELEMRARHTVPLTTEDSTKVTRDHALFVHYRSRNSMNIFKKTRASGKYLTTLSLRHYDYTRVVLLPTRNVYY